MSSLWITLEFYDLWQNLDICCNLFQEQEYPECKITFFNLSCLYSPQLIYDTSFVRSNLPVPYDPSFPPRTLTIKFVLSVPSEESPPYLLLVPSRYSRGALADPFWKVCLTVHVLGVTFSHETDNYVIVPSHGLPLLHPLPLPSILVSPLSSV